jgi:HNH endonuclease
LGQGAFRVSVTDVYQRRCVITQERTLPALEAAHIRPYGDGGGHEASNGLLLRRDIYSLFDAGYVTVTPELRFEVSGGYGRNSRTGGIIMALRSNPGGNAKGLDCFVARAPRNDGERFPFNYRTPLWRCHLPVIAIKLALEYIPLMEYIASMAWNLEHTDEFAEWYHGLSEAQQDDITAAGLLLMEQGPQLPFPYSSPRSGTKD